MPFERKRCSFGALSNSQDSPDESHEIVLSRNPFLFFSLRWKDTANGKKSSFLNENIFELGSKLPIASAEKNPFSDKTTSKH